MNRILLIFEDYSELTTTEVYLKKVGFDVLGISNEVLMSEQMLSFNPDIVVASGKSSRVSTLSVGQKLKENHRFFGKSVLIFPKGAKPQVQEMLRLRMDGVLEAPVEPLRLIQVLAKLTNQDVVQLADKYQKSHLSEDGVPRDRKVIGRVEDGAELDSSIFVRGKPQASPQASRYDKHLKDIKIDIQETSFNRQALKERQKELKKDWNFDELEEIDRLKEQFAQALFKKAARK